MSQYLLDTSCPGCPKLGDIGPESSALGILEFGLAMYGVYALLTSKTVGKLVSKTVRKSRRRRR